MAKAEEKMVEMVVLKGVTVGRPGDKPLMRGGKQVMGEDGKAVMAAKIVRFSPAKPGMKPTVAAFTEAEIKEILAQTPDALRPPESEVTEKAPAKAPTKGGDDL